MVNFSCVQCTGRYIYRYYGEKLSSITLFAGLVSGLIAYLDISRRYLTMVKSKFPSPFLNRHLKSSILVSSSIHSHYLSNSVYSSTALSASTAPSEALATTISLPVTAEILNNKLSSLHRNKNQTGSLQCHLMCSHAVHRHQ